MDLITNALGEVEGRYGYDPFGGPRDGSWHTTEKLHSGTYDETTDRGFTGHEHLDDQRLIHMNGRTYDYRLGRFLSVDPVIADLADSQTLNPYSYVRNNPLAFTDPSGFEAVSVTTENGRYLVETVAQTNADGRQVQLVRVTFEDGSTVTFDFAAGYVSLKGPPEDAGGPSLASKAMEGVGSFLNGVLRGLVGWQHSGAAPGFEDLYALGQIVGATAGLALDAEIALGSLSVGAGGVLSCAGGATCAVSPAALTVAGTGLAVAYEGSKFHTALLAEGLSDLGGSSGPGSGRGSAEALKDFSKVATRTTRDGGRGVRLTRQDGSVVDITSKRVKEFVRSTHPSAPPGTIERVKFPNAQPGTKGFKRDPTPDELRLLEEAFK